MDQSPQRRAFTIIETLVVISIIAAIIVHHPEAKYFNV